MEKRIGNKEKRYVVLLLFLLLFALGYTKLFKNTIRTIKDYNQLKSLNIDSLKIKNEIKETQLVINNLDKIVGSEVREQDLVKQNILSFTSKSHSKIIVTSLEETQIFKNNDFTIYSTLLTVEGNYNTILEYLFAIENKFELSKVVSVKLFKKKDYGTKKEKLYARVIFQNYKTS